MVVFSSLQQIRLQRVGRWAFFFALLCIIPWSLFAQISFRVEAPRTVSLSEKIRVQFVLQNADGSEFRAPEVEGASVLFPPNNAISRANINGRISVTYTGTYLAEHTGTIRIGKASIKVKGKTYYTAPLEISVLADEKGGGNSQNQVSKATDMFIRATPSKTSAYEQEAILITYKIYTRNANIDFENVKFPEYDGFIEHVIERSRNVQLAMERINGKSYYSAILHQTLIFPQRSGMLHIPQGEFDLVAAVEQRIEDEDDFFGMSSVSQVRKKILSPTIDLNIKELPKPAPDGFDGAVGSFTLKLEIPDRDQIKTNEQMSLRLTISGQGNLKLITPPSVKWPDSFEPFDPQSEAKLRASIQGVTGTRTIEYYVVPRNEGRFTIPPIELIYFDPQRGTYQTVKTAAITLDVAKGDQSGVYDTQGQTDIELLGHDIASLKDYGEGDSRALLRFMGSLWYPLLYILLSGIGLVFALVYRHLQKRQQDVVGRRLRGAGKVAQKHLAQARLLLHSGADDAFYEALFTALQGYIADKFLLDRSQLSHQQIAQTLADQGYPTEVIDPFLQTLSQIEFARFSPSAGGLKREQILQEATTAIETMERHKATDL